VVLEDEEPAPILLTADLVADLLTPSPRPRLMAGGRIPAAVEAQEASETPAPVKRGRGKAKPKADAPAAGLVADVAPAPAKRSPRPRAAKPVSAEAGAAAPVVKSRKK